MQDRRRKRSSPCEHVSDRHEYEWDDSQYIVWRTDSLTGLKACLKRARRSALAEAEVKRVPVPVRIEYQDRPRLQPRKTPAHHQRSRSWHRRKIRRQGGNERE